MNAKNLKPNNSTLQRFPRCSPTEIADDRLTRFACPAGLVLGWPTG